MWIKSIHTVSDYIIGTLINSIYFLTNAIAFLKRSNAVTITRRITILDNIIFALSRTSLKNTTSFNELIFIYSSSTNISLIAFLNHGRLTGSTDAVSDVKSSTIAITPHTIYFRSFSTVININIFTVVGENSSSDRTTNSFYNPMLLRTSTANIAQITLCKCFLASTVYTSVTCSYIA